MTAALAGRSAARRYRPVRPRPLVDRQRRHRGRVDRRERAHRSHQGGRRALALLRGRQRLARAAPGGSMSNPICEHLDHGPCWSWTARSRPNSSGAARIFSIRCGRRKCLLEQPQLIRDVHLDYFRAGADVATTATYQATFEGFARRGIGHEAAAQLMRDAVALAASARDEFWSVPANRAARLRPLIAASVGPYGAMLGDGAEYRGQLRGRAIARSRPFTGRASRCWRSPAPICWPARPCRACARRWCSRACCRIFRRSPRGSAFPAGTARTTARASEIARCAAALREHPQVAAVGVNCTAPEHVGDLLLRMREATDKPLLAYPNSGERYEAHDASAGAGRRPRRRSPTRRAPGIRRVRV